MCVVSHFFLSPFPLLRHPHFIDPNFFFFSFSLFSRLSTTFRKQNKNKVRLFSFPPLSSTESTTAPTQQRIVIRADFFSLCEPTLCIRGQKLARKRKGEFKKWRHDNNVDNTQKYQQYNTPKTYFLKKTTKTTTTTTTTATTTVSTPTAV